MKTNFYRTALVLGLISAIGPFAIDMYLPALPSIGHSLGASIGAVQASLMSFFIALALGQLVYGPASDMLGRKPPLFFSLGLFVLGSVGCALAPDIQTLVALRFVQGLGASAGMVICRAIVRDLHTGVDAARLMSLLMLVFSVAPILAPLAGSLLIEWSSWRSVFWAVMLIAVAALVVMATSLAETRPAADRQGSTASSAVRAYGVLLRDSHFLGLVFIGAFGMASFFSFLANAPFVMINHFGLTPRQFSLAFALNAASFIGVSQFTGKVAARFGLMRMVTFSVTGYAVVMSVLLLQNLLGLDRLDVLIVLMLIGFGFLGLVVPATSVLALETHGAIAGTASALMGTLQLASGAVVMAVVSQFVDGSPLPMIAGIAGSALVALSLAWLSLRKEGS